MERALTALQKRVGEGKLKDRNKIERRLGKIQARHPQVADLYEVGVTEKDGALALQWQALEGRQTWQRAREGAYLLRTNLPPQEPVQMWKSYIQLTEAEAAFRVLKSELSIRPIFHQLERRAKAHILVAFLGYALWVTLKHLLIRKGSDLSPARALGVAGHVGQRGYRPAHHRRPRDPFAAHHHAERRTKTSARSAEHRC